MAEILETLCSSSYSSFLPFLALLTTHSSIDYGQCFGKTPYPDFKCDKAIYGSNRIERTLMKTVEAQMKINQVMNGIDMKHRHLKISLTDARLRHTN